MLFTSSKKRLEQRMLRQCLNVEKPEEMTAMNLLGRPAGWVQPVSWNVEEPPAGFNTLGRVRPSEGVKKPRRLPFFA